ncbi:PorP/SprF family type IX secretion system membrane protein [Mesonia aestuariivivens]|uniref:Type IX secretion system membrane protein PorP/SprF n=1 Tax=Mesonia aestuariivivens TaxID=2796128 RepID=A0ABS6W3I0_9FLAO|nr:type IX secretion system membrane protein PorP/SprF [Mesonia aestuariivivens]MBW2962421.1 type IX secretion system membrane protein PorP/SprF [Mesonia aestuariivivens]
MKKNNSLLILLFLFISANFYAQERGIPVYTDYLTDNLYLLHPSMAGAASQTKLRLTGRRQWFGVNDAPALETVSLNGRVGDKVGLGGIFYNDSNGRFSQQGVYATFAYHLLLSRNTIDLNQLSFGLSVGVMQEKLDETQLIGGPNPNDPNISGVEQRDSFFNIDFGMSYYLFEFYTHFTVKNLIPQQRDIFSQQFETDNQRQYLLSAGYIIAPYGSEWSYEPSIMFQMKEETSEASIDVNAKVYRDFDFGKLWGGLSYRRSFDGAEYTTDGASSVSNQKLQYLSPFIGINYKNFMFAYTYAYQANSIVLANSGFHQITLGYNFGENKEPYECNCPAINY